MKRREKIIAIAIALVIGGVFFYSVVNALVIKPIRETNTAGDTNSKKKQGLDAENALAPLYKRGIADAAAKTLPDLDMAMKIIRLRLDRLAELSGFSKARDTYSAQSTTNQAKGRVKAYDEVIWTVKARGTLAEVTKFLYAVKSEPYLTRIISFDIDESAKLGYDLALKFATPVIRQQRGEKFATSQPAEKPPAITLADADQVQLAMIVGRDIFRPYIKKVVVIQPPPPEDPPPDDTKIPPPPPPPPPQPDPATLMSVVGLTEVAGKVDVILIKDRRQGGNAPDREFKIGDVIAYDVEYVAENKLQSKHVTLKIVTVDYRPRAIPSVNPNDMPFYSPSRLIVLEGDRYASVELGELLSQRRELKDSQLPDPLRADMQVQVGNVAGPGAVEG